MNWQDEGFLLSKIKFKENANIINVFTNTHGKVSGIVYGGNSRKIRNFLQNILTTKKKPHLYCLYLLF
jgi:DNA repair protein RecO (recombination protein O)